MTPGAGRTVVVAGALAQRPGIAGHAWVFLNWLHGLRSLGFDVLFVDRLEVDMLDDARVPVRTSRQWNWLWSVLRGAGFARDFAVLTDDGQDTVGLSRDDLMGRVRGAAALFNFMGYLRDDDISAAVERRIFVDIDPGFPQLWRRQGLHDAFAGHDAVATVGLMAGAPAGTGANIASETGLPTVATLPPVSLSHWPALPVPDVPVPRVTSVATWRGPFGPIEHDGVHYGLRVHEFRRFVGLPALAPSVEFELALDIDPADRADRALLTSSGWALVDPGQAVATVSSYRNYIAASSAELMIAKGLYVRSQGGWFSDRSACYLASGRPVVAQDTGFSAHLPTGKGLLAFTDLEGARAAVDDVAYNLALHSEAARALAEQYLDGRRVLTTLLQQLDVIE